MAGSAPVRRGWRTRAFALLGGLALAAISALLVLVVLEAAMRLVPALLPSGSYGSGRRHPELGMNVYAGPVIYNKVRRVTREPNAEGFLDVAHERRKPPGVVRLGFFGDSYVESKQVPLDVVFHRRLDETLGPAVETLAFGIAGWGTYQELRVFRTFAPAYDLDAAIYVFVENDLGDQLFELAAKTPPLSSAYPFAQLDDAAPDGFREQWVRDPEKQDLGWRLGKLLQQHSLLARAVRDRLTILRSYGVSWSADRAAQQMTQKALEVPRSTDLPGTWPEEWRKPAQELGRRVLAAWAREARAQGIRFAVLYVPRSEEQLLGGLPLEQTWKPWLEQTTAELGVPLLDPSGPLRAALESGTAVYDDHWTPAGHEVIAKALAEFTRDWLGPAPSGSAAGHAATR